ncbi:MAG: hypothetical protein K8T20_07450 [Planctomycetes bacterium]|nr:hypothetical protein [Planctomycetota bacterium]
MSRHPDPARTAVRLFAVAILFALALAAALENTLDRRAAARAAAFSEDVEDAAKHGSPGEERLVVADILVAAASNDVSIDFLDVSVRDGQVCVRAEFKTEAALGPWHWTRKYEKRTSAPFVAGR